MSAPEPPIYPALVAFVLVTAIQATLKLLGIIDWSWWLVTLPLWGLASLASLGMIALGLYVGFEALQKRMNSKR